MKKEFAIVFLLNTSFLYFGLSFYQWNLNAGLWTLECRFVFVLIWTILVPIISFGIVSGQKKYL